MLEIIIKKKKKSEEYGIAFMHSDFWANRIVKAARNAEIALVRSVVLDRRESLFSFGLTLGFWPLTVTEVQSEQS